MPLIGGWVERCIEVDFVVDIDDVGEYSVIVVIPRGEVGDE